MNSGRGLYSTAVYRHAVWLSWAKPLLRASLAATELLLSSLLLMTKNQLCHLWSFKRVQMGSRSKCSSSLPMLHGFGRSWISPKQKSILFANKSPEKVDEKRLWLGHCSLMALKAVFEPHNPSSAGRRLTKAQTSSTRQAGEGFTKLILTLYRPLAEYFGSWGCLEMPHKHRGLSRFASGRLPALCLSEACLSL